MNIFISRGGEIESVGLAKKKGEKEKGKKKSLSWLHELDVWQMGN